MQRGGRRILLAAGLALVALGATASLARADDSLIRISEVYNDAAATHGDYVELQMLADGQQIPANSAIRICTATGGTCVNYLFPANSLPASVSQRTVLVGWDDNPNADFGIPAGFNYPFAGGSACYETSVAPNVPRDCVAWGNYTAGAVSVGSPAPALNAGASLTRTEARGCPTLMEAIDDSDDSAADFSLAPLTPRNNLQTPTEAPCPSPSAAPAPGTPTAKKKCKKKKHASAVAAKKKCKKKRRHALATTAAAVDFGPDVVMTAESSVQPARDDSSVVSSQNPADAAPVTTDNVPVSQLPHHKRKHRHKHKKHRR